MGRIWEEQYQNNNKETIPITIPKNLQIKLCSLAVFTIEDEQIVWTDKSSDVKTGRINFQTTVSSEFVRLSVCPSVCSSVKTICPSR